MTTAHFEQTDSTFEVTISGHAGYETGKPDIVCAACSMLAYTLLESILAIEDMGGLAQFNSKMEQEAGYYHITLTAYTSMVHTVEIIMSTISTGFALLQHTYPANVKLKIVRSGEK